ncbi:hypothetical protein [Rhizobium sp. SSA_523]|uniref:hypothetical protein n=1 Tax=Rhizobium sp. SSA_523 TaxID=2952477 RepID=UPI002091D8E9|nr:hypothetical protein [Rhizobium sp. SSA_523]MCO5731250.1 hypothetical protein [Rhizobium sp. SSA_523]WKC22212.1 hypothetical protein QTJ18_03465 [Rhizobium sp. SSA_523]
MQKRPHIHYRRMALMVASLTLLGATLAGCVSDEERRYQGASTCESFGAPYGSRAYTACMLQQQGRRDAAQMESLERTRMTQEIARNAQEMADRARFDRCRRDPDRRECRR